MCILPEYGCRVLEAIGPKVLAIHLRTFCDYLATQLQSCLNKEEFLTATDAVRNMVWSYHLFTLDRFLLCLVCIRNNAAYHTVCYKKINA